MVEFLGSVAKILEEDSGESPVVENKGDLLKLVTSKNELVIRIDGDNLVVERIELNNQRKGYGTRIVQELVKIAKNKRFDRILLEITSTPAGVKLAEKNGFLPILSSGMYIDDYFVGTWELPLRSNTTEEVLV